MHKQVDDILVKQAQAVMVVESPHGTEVETGIALSGESGRVVSRTLIDREEPIGLLCKDGSVRLSVVNTFSQPRQDVPGIRRPELLMRLDSLEYRDDPIKYKEEITQLLAATQDRGLLDKYKERLQMALCAGARQRIVVCGLIAQAVFEWSFGIARTSFLKPFRCQIDSSLVEVFYIWHPSHNSGDDGSAWKDPKNSRAISALKKFIGLIML